MHNRIYIIIISITIIMYTIGVFIKWKYDTLNILDIITYSSLSLSIYCISWFSNRKIEKTLLRAKRSESLLAKERNLLEEKISKKTESLLAVERIRISNMEHAAEFGELSKGIFHDLMNPLTSIALCLERASKNVDEYSETKELIDKAVSASKRLGSFMDSVRRAIDNPDNINEGINEGPTCIADEITFVCDVLAYKARQSNVEIIIGQCDNIIIDTHPARVHQVFLNLISNAVDACINKKSLNRNENKTIHISSIKDNTNIIIKISDNGCGIPSYIKKRIFKYSVSNKNNGTGRGLITVKSIVEMDMRGTITVDSIRQIGTTFTITIPLHKGLQQK